MSTQTNRPRVPPFDNLGRSLIHPYVIVVFIYLVAASFIDTQNLIGQLLAIPSFIPILVLDLIETATSTSLGQIYPIILYPTYYVFAAIIVQAYFAAISQFE